MLAQSESGEGTDAAFPDSLLPIEVGEAYEELRCGLMSL